MQLTTDFNTGLSISVMAIDPINSDIVYIGASDNQMRKILLNGGSNQIQTSGSYGSGSLSNMEVLSSAKLMIVTDGEKAAVINLVTLAEVKEKGFGHGTKIPIYNTLAIVPATTMNGWNQISFIFEIDDRKIHSWSVVNIQSSFIDCHNSKYYHQFKVGLCLALTDIPDSFGPNDTTWTTERCTDPNCQRCPLDYTKCLVCNQSGDYKYRDNSDQRCYSIADMPVGKGASDSNNTVEPCSVTNCIDCKNNFSKCEMCNQTAVEKYQV